MILDDNINNNNNNIIKCIKIVREKKLLVDRGSSLKCH